MIRMQIKYPWLCVAFLLLGLCALPTPTQAAPTALTVAQSLPFANDPSGFNQPIDVVVVLDDSGSMATCWPWPRDGGQPFGPPCGGRSVNPPSDPEELRYSAARLLLQLAADNDRVAVIRFDNAAEGVGELGVLQPVGSLENRQRLTASLTPPTDYLRRGYTRIDLGLQAAIDQLAAVREPGRNQYVLLLTDGEPSGPEGFGGQGEAIRAGVAALREAGVLVFPVVLCNPTAGCAGEFLSQELPELNTRQAATPQELLRVFSELFAAMKPDLSVITSRTGNGVQLTTREGHGVRRLAFVTARDGLTAIRRDDQPVLAQSYLDDPLIAVNLIEGEGLAAGRWQADMNDAGGFVVVQSDSYPQLLNPPPSLANSPASVRYYPAGKPLLLIARSGGPGAAEPLLYEGVTQLDSFLGTEFKSLRINEPVDEVRLQVGDDQAPLQLVRTFQLAARSDLPPIEIFSPTSSSEGLLPDGHARLEVGFGGSAAVQNLAATVLVTDESNDEQGGGTLVYQGTMRCDERLCRDDNFVPGDGRSYKITYIVQAVKDGLRFSDWDEATLELKPAVQVRGLPAQLDLAQMPAEGWPVELASGTTEPIGALTASLALRRADTNEPVSTVALSFEADVPETGVVTATMRVDGLETVRPGEYVGEITLKATRPNGQPMEVAIRPGATLPVTFKVARPLALVDSQLADFGEFLFDTSPNFRINQEVLLPVNFVGKRFRITAALEDSSCADLTLVSGEVREQDGRTVLPLQLSSRGPVPPGACSGVISLKGPDADHDIFPQQVDWQVRVNDVEWSLVSGSLDLGDLQDAGSRSEATLAVRFSGKTPFLLQMANLQAEGQTQDGTLTLTGAELEMAPVEVTGEPNAAGVYEVPVTFTTRRALPRDPMRGAVFTGQVTLNIVGLPEKAQTLSFTFRSPSVVQRYISPYVRPIYGQLPLALCAWPLTLFLLLVAVARLRSRGIDDVEIDEATVATTTPLTPPAEVAPLASGTTFASPPAMDAVWGNAEWGGAWGSDEANERPAVGAYPANGSNGTDGDDPWRSSW
jgi:hypothetical protein